MDDNYHDLLSKYRDDAFSLDCLFSFDNDWSPSLLLNKIKAARKMNKTALDLSFIEKAIANLAEDEKCIDLHAGSCNQKAMLQVRQGTKSMAGLYLLVHLLPLIINFRKTAKDPKQSVIKSLKGFVKSMLFVSGSLFLIRRGICFFTQHYRYSNINAIITGWICGLALLLESPGRQAEISLFCLARCSDMAYRIVLRRHSWLWLHHGQNYLNALSIATICYFFFEDSKTLRGHYQKLLNMIIKDV